MRGYLDLWILAFEGILALIIVVIYPVIWLLLEILPYGITCLIRGTRLKKGYRYLYFLPTFIKDITVPLRRSKHQK